MIPGFENVNEQLDALTVRGDLISRQAAIALAKDICVLTKDGTVYKHRCIDPDAIKELPSVQPEIIRCKDCVKREYCRTSTAWAIPPKDDWYCADAVPTVEPERKTGKWGEAHRRGVLTYADIYAECSACHSEPVFNGWEMRYCPNCGAKMEGEA